MAQGSEDLSNQVTVLVFKDNYAARTFHIPLGWISRLGVSIGLLLLLAIGASILAFKNYRALSRTSPLHIHELEQENSELRSHLKELQEKQVKVTESSPSNKKDEDPTSQASDKPFLFSNLSSQSIASQLEGKKLPIQITEPSFQWKGQSLKLKFAFQYVLEDKGSQSGKFILLARGRDHIVSYPQNSLNLSGNSPLMDLKQAETFSVSRFRAVDATFQGVHSPKSIQEIEVYLFNDDDQIIHYQKMDVKNLDSSHHVSRPPKRQEPAPMDSEITPPTDITPPIQGEPSL